MPCCERANINNQIHITFINWILIKIMDIFKHTKFMMFRSLVQRPKYFITITVGYCVIPELKHKPRR